APWAGRKVPAGRCGEGRQVQCPTWACQRGTPDSGPGGPGPGGIGGRSAQGRLWTRTFGLLSTDLPGVKPGVRPGSGLRGEALKGWGASGPARPPRRPCPAQVLPARAGPRADAVGARASRGAPGGPGALARCVLRDGAGLDQLPAAPQVLLRLPPLLHRPRQRVQGVHDAHTGPVSPVPPQPLSPHARLSLPLPPSLSLSLSRPNVVLGVTNPFFIKTLQHWPHILRVGEPRMSGDLPKQVKLKKPSRLKTLDTKPGLYTAYTAHLHRDKALLRRLLKGLQKKRPSDVQTALLRRHLLELTQSFIFPLEHYMASLMPLQKSITPWKTPPQIRPFRQDDFLRSLEHAGPQLTCVLKGDWLGLYRRFFKSPHFDGWYRQRRKEMAQKLEALHLEAICEANIEVWMKGKSEVEVVDLVLKLRERLVRRLPAPCSTASQRQRSPAPDHRCPCRCGHRATSSL
uniref:UDENN domain-containing protein n=1 Tax=Sus scrofa TaxID=9823 RepID=A0A8D0TX87_PIG